MITEEQRKERIKYLGSSDAAAACGLSRWKTQLQLWAEKTGQIEPPDLSDKLSVRLGNRLEEVVAELFTEETGKKVHRVRETIFHKNYSFLAANLDRRVVGEDSVLECKTTSAWAAKEWMGEEIPQECIIQVMHQLIVTGKQYGYAAVLIGGNQHFRWKRIDRDPGLIAQILQREKDFWIKYVEPKVMPITIKADDSDVLAQLFPGGEEEEIELDADANALAETIRNLQADFASLKDMIEADKNKLKQKLGNHNVGKTPKYRITWRPQTNERLDLDAFREEEEDMYEKYLRSTTTRTLRINEIREEKNGND